jgi:hypothetical protein
MGPSVAAIQQAIDDYHALLTPEVAQDTWQRITAVLAERRLTFGDRTFLSVLRPRFVTRERYDAINAECFLLMRAFDRAYNALLADATLRLQICLTPEEEYTLGLDPGYEPPTVSTRLDCFVTPDGGFQSVEYNAESPAGIAYADALAELFLELPVMQAFQRRYHVEPHEIRARQLDAMLEAWRRWGGQGLPTIGIIDWPGVPTVNEFHLFADYFARHGIRSVIASPDEMAYANGVLTARDVPINLVYKRVLISELLERYGTEHPIVDAVGAHAACMINGFRAKLLHKKAIHAVLSDERNAELFDGEQRGAIARHIPWTRLVEERHTRYQGERIDLVPWIAEHREQLVLKPNDEYGGKGVVIGWESGDAEWQAALQAALAGPTVVQDRVVVASEDFAALTPDGQVDISPRLVDADPYFFLHREVYGYLTRLSTQALLNVTAGGGSVVPTFVVTPK